MSIPVARRRSQHGQTAAARIRTPVDAQLDLDPAAGDAESISGRARVEGRARGMSATPEPEPSPAVDTDPVVLGADGLRGRARRVRCRRRAALHGSDRFRQQLVHRPRPWLVRRPVVVGRRDRRGRSPCRSPPTVDPPARRDVRPDCRPARRTRRPTPGPRHRGRLGRLPHRRCQPGPGKGARLGRRRARHLDLSAPPIQRGGFPDHHTGRLRRRLRRTVLQHRHRGHDDHGDRPSRRPPVHQGPGQHDRLLERLVRALLRRRRHRLPGRLPGPAIRRSRTGTCWQQFRSACSPPS